MSDNYAVTIQEIDLAKAKLVFRVRSEPGNGYEGESISRSFVLLLLAEAREKAAYQMKVSSKPTKIEKESATFVDGWWGDEAFMRTNVSKYVRVCRITSRGPGNRTVQRRAFPEKQEGAFNEHYDRVLENEALNATQREDELCRVLPFYLLEAELTDAKWLQGLSVGWTFGTTAYDVWEE